MLIIFFGLPIALFAHATPVAYEPAGDRALEEVPSVVSIRFTERPEPALSQMRVFGPEGTAVHSTGARVADDDPWLLVVPISDDGHGRYMMEWNVVSADDGHFTRGVHSFVVGTSTQSASMHEHGHHHAAVEYNHATAAVVSSTMELFGNGILWGVLVLLSLLYRPLRRESDAASVASLERLLWWSIVFGLLLFIVGVLWHIIQTAADLVVWQDRTWLEAVQVYLTTVLGTNVLLRLGLLVFAGVTMLCAWRYVTRSPVLTLFEAVVLITLVLFAYVRSLLSHATADPFYPDVSTVINLLHLIEKDMWAGMIAILFVGACVWTIREQILARLPHITVLLTVNMLGLALTATYIIWLQLKSFENIWSTEWGAQLQLLVAAAILLVSVRVVQIALARFAPTLLGRTLSLWLGVELVFAVAVIYGSSLIMLSSPPLLEPVQQAIKDTDSGISIELSEHRANPEQLLISVSDERTTGLVVTLKSRQNTAAERVIPTEQRFVGGYTFKREELYGPESWHLDVQAQRHNAYDVQASFNVGESWQDASIVEGHGRTYNFYTKTLLGIGVLAAVGILALIVVARRIRPFTGVDTTPQHRLSYAALGVLLGLLLLLIVLLTVQAVIGNSFYEQCIRAGDEWHIMQPMREGELQSHRTLEGCMTADGLHHFVDKREYIWHQENL